MVENAESEVCLSSELDSKRQELLQLLADCGQVVVAFSGGVAS